MMQTVSSLKPLSPIMGPQATQDVTSKKNGMGFSDFLNNAIQNAENTAEVSREMTNALLSGETDDLHSVTIAGEKADLALNLVIQVRNKVVDAYNEIMRMQV